jgi:hypothetical protein
MTNKNQNKNQNQKGKQQRRKKTPTLVTTIWGSRPQKRDKNNRLIDYEFVGKTEKRDKDGKLIPISYWQKKSVRDIPTCDTLVREIRTNMTRDPAFRIVNHFTNNGLSEFFSANPNLVIDSMNILMANGDIDEYDFDEVFEQTIPFNKVEWKLDKDYNTYKWEEYQAASDDKIGSRFPPQGKRSKTDFSKWLETQSKVYVKEWKGKVQAYGRQFKTEFAVSRIKGHPHRHTGLSNYFVGNRAEGDRPILQSMLKIKTIPAAKYTRGLPENTIMAAYPSKKRIAAERLKARRQIELTPDETFGDNAMDRLMSGETLTL